MLRPAAYLSISIDGGFMGGNIAVGSRSNATGNSSNNVASGFQSNASGNGSSNVASGDTANASGNSSNNSGYGSHADASGDGSENVAIGSGAVARGAATQNTAVGSHSEVEGNDASAFGAGAIAPFVNSAAFGADAIATRINQQVFGTSLNTYTFPGLTSKASLAALSGPASILVTDPAGNLAAVAIKNANGKPVPGEHNPTWPIANQVRVCAEHCGAGQRTEKDCKEQSSLSHPGSRHLPEGLFYGVRLFSATGGMAMVIN